MSTPWVQFWNRPHRIYVNHRHLQVHYARIADDILSILPRGDALRLLDYGCGDALDAARVAAAVGALDLYDAAPTVRAALEARLGGKGRIHILDDDAIATLGAASYDVIVLFSVIQYISKDELPDLLRRMRGWLVPGGLLVIADTIPPQASLLDDVRALLTTAARNGFLTAALFGLAATAFSDYRRLRQTLGLSIYDESEILNLLRETGFAAAPHHRNLGFHPVRRTYLARPA